MPEATHHSPRRIRLVPLLVAAGLTLVGSIATGAPTADAVATTNGQVVYPYACTTSFVGGASYSDASTQVGITDVRNGPGVHTYGGGPVATQVRVALEVPPAAVSALLGTGTTTWTSTDAVVGWGGTSSPATSFTWQVPPIPRFSDRTPISFTTAGFTVPGPGDVSPGPLSWGFQADAGAQPGFRSGHVQCTPVAPVQVYETFLPASGPSCAHLSTRWTCRFSYTGTAQLWQVPRDVTQVTVDVRGASGGGIDPTGFLSDIDKVWPGGRGGQSIATVSVTPGEYLALMIGGTSGFNGGGIADGSVFNGGGGTDVRRAPYGLAQRLVVAGGGGGGGLDVGCIPDCADNSGGAGGGTTGVGAGGGPGTQTSGGAPQPGGDPAVPSTAGSFGTGGSGGAGGGGGYFGGGGGAFFDGFSAIGGGGGGSGFVPAGPGSTTLVGTNSGDGSVSITYTSSTTPYTSRYTADEARWLTTVQAALHSRDQAGAQHDAALFMAFLGVLVRAAHAAPPALGSAPGSGPVAVTSTYTRAENAALLRASALFRSDPPTLQRSGVALLALLLGRS